MFGRDHNNMDSAYSLPVTNYNTSIISHQFNLASCQGQFLYAGAVSCCAGDVDTVQTTVCANSCGVKVYEAACFTCTCCCTDSHGACVSSNATQGYGVVFRISVNDGDVFSRACGQGDVETWISVQAFCDGQGNGVTCA